MLIDNVKTLNDMARASLANAMRGARRELGKGFYRSRGKWVIVTRVDGGEPFISAGQLEWKGTQKQLQALLTEYLNDPAVQAMYIDGGVDHADSLQAFGEGWYDPWVAEWSITIFNREDWAKNA